jgi:signal-transduction protein with cAMP-binding, CBS, and nucleotidyltransferase domain
MQDQAFQFLSKLPPFTFLPEEELQKIAMAVSMKHYPKDKDLFVQGRSRVEQNNKLLPSEMTHAQLSA